MADFDEEQPTTPCSADLVWYVCWNGTEPYEIREDDLSARLAAGELDDTVLVWTAGLMDWQPASELPVLLEARSPAPASRPSVVTGSIFGGAVLQEVQTRR